MKYALTLMLTFILSIATLSAQAQAPAVREVLAAKNMTPQEAENVKTVVAWTQMMQQAHVREAFEKFVAKDFVEHAHMVAREAQKEKAGFEDAIVFFEKRFGKNGIPPATATNPDIAKKVRANDEMVTMFGDIGVDVFRVINGKITDHWDASPPRD